MIKMEVGLDQLSDMDVSALLLIYLPLIILYI